MQTELLQVIAIVEEIVTDLTPRAAELLELMSAGETITATEGPRTNREERRRARWAHPREILTEF